MRFAFLVAAVLLYAVRIVAAQNVVLFVTDDQGQVAGCYGNPVIKTPNLDALAADATRFQYAYATTASCSPSRSVILTGLFNHANGQYGLQHAAHHFQSFDDVKSLPVLLSAAGYRTARVGKFHVAPDSVYRFDEALPGNPHNPVAMAERCRELIESPSERPFFLYFCTADPHRGGGQADEIAERPDRFGNKPRGQSYPRIEPVHYEPADVIVPPFLPDTPACRAELAQYYESISRVDTGLGRLIEILKQAGKYDDTLIIYISDNGMPFPGAKTTAYEPGLRLPCIVRNPQAKKRGIVSEAMVSWVDITPTILDFAGVEPTAGMAVSRPVVPADSRTGEAARLGRNLCLAHVSRSDDVLSDARRPQRPLQAHLEHRPSAAVSIRIGFVELGDVAGSSPRRPRFALRQAND